uniref:Secreted protein n=1 Tax=Timema poppense TaxID=170557 RepID=A0A7R9GTP4_TIMPO|nr:unnamed protein product [Timema poppensis]
MLGTAKVHVLMVLVVVLLVTCPAENHRLRAHGSRYVQFDYSFLTLDGASELVTARYTENVSSHSVVSNPLAGDVTDESQCAPVPNLRRQPWTGLSLEV